MKNKGFCMDDCFVGLWPIFHLVDHNQLHIRYLHSLVNKS